MLGDLTEAPVPQLALLALSSSLSPGPNNLLLAACASWFGARRTLPTALGMYIGFGLMLLAAGLGLAAALLRWPALLQMLQWGGAAYLAYLAAKLLRAQWAAPSSAAAPPGLVRAAVLQFANPKLWLMTLSTISLCTPAGHSRPSVALVTGFVLMTVPSMLLYLHLGGLLHRLAGAPQARRVVNLMLAVTTAGSALLMVAPPAGREWPGTSGAAQAPATASGELAGVPRARRQWAGDNPTVRLKARLNAASDS